MDPSLRRSFVARGKKKIGHIWVNDAYIEEPETIADVIERGDLTALTRHFKGGMSPDEKIAWWVDENYSHWFPDEYEQQKTIEIPMI